MQETTGRNTADSTAVRQMSATRMAALIAAGKLSSAAVVRVCLERISALDDVVRAFVALDPDRALATARAAEPGAVSPNWSGSVVIARSRSRARPTSRPSSPQSAS